MSEEFDKYEVADIIREEGKKKGINCEVVNLEGARGCRCPLIQLSKGVHKVRISVHDSGMRKHGDQCWVGIGFSDLNKLEDMPKSFIVVVEKLRHDCVIVPLKRLRSHFHLFSGGQSFKLWIEAGSYRLGHKRGFIVALNDLQPIFETVGNSMC